MLNRCYNTRNNKFESYGARGIKVCDRWKDIRNFIEDMGPKPLGTSIERRDNAKGYEPSNCYWGTPTDQGRNTRRVKLTMERATQMRQERGLRQKEIAAKYGVSVSTVQSVLYGYHWKQIT